MHIITSTQGVAVVKNEKENMHTPRCNFLRRSSHNKLLQIFLWEKWGEGEFFLKTLGRQIDVKREIHIHLYLANNSVLV